MALFDYKISHGERFDAQVHPVEGYIITNIRILMGGIELTGVDNINHLGGDIVIEKANEVLKQEFPEFNIQITVPDEYTRRVGQSIAAASLPKGK